MEPSLMQALNNTPTYSNSFPYFIVIFLFWHTRFRELPTTSRGRFKMQFDSSANTFVIQILSHMEMAFSVFLQFVEVYCRFDKNYKLLFSSQYANVLQAFFFLQNNPFLLIGVLGRTQLFAFASASPTSNHNSHYKKRVYGYVQYSTVNVHCFNDFPVFFCRSEISSTLVFVFFFILQTNPTQGPLKIAAVI